MRGGLRLWSRRTRMARRAAAVAGQWAAHHGAPVASGAAGQVDACSSNNSAAKGGASGAWGDGEGAVWSGGIPTAEVARRRRALARRVWTWTAAKRPKWRILTKRGGGGGSREGRGRWWGGRARLRG